MNRRLLIALILIMLLAIAAFAVYYFYFRDGEEAAPAGEGEVTRPVSPLDTVVAVDEKLKRISAGPAVSPVASENGKSVVYAGLSSGIYETGFDGTGTKETKSTPPANFFRALWSPDRKELISLHDTAEGRRFYHLKSGVAAPFDQNVSSVTFSKTERKVAYVRRDNLEETNSVFVSDPDGTNARTVMHTRLRDMQLAWVSEKEIALFGTPSGLAATSLLLLNTDSQKLSSVLSNVFGLTVKWDQKGNQFLFSQTGSDGKNMSLFVSNKNGTQIKKLDVVTLPEKCAFSPDGKTAACAAPEIAPPLVWPDDYYRGLYSAREQIWSVNLQTGKKELLYEFAPSATSDARDLVLSSAGDTLVFVNRKDGSLFSLKLK